MILQNNKSVICFFNNCSLFDSLFDKPNLFNNYKIWKKVLSNGKDNILRYMLKHEIAYESLENNISYIKLYLIPYRKKRSEQYKENYDQMKKRDKF